MVTENSTTIKTEKRTASRYTFLLCVHKFTFAKSQMKGVNP
jgi:hypothetical protein